MNADELLDAHTKRMQSDPGYAAIWEHVQAAPTELRVLLAMGLWAECAAVMRAALNALSATGQAHASPELIALLDRGLKYGIVGCDCYSATNAVEADEIRKLIGEARA